MHQENSNLIEVVDYDPLWPRIYEQLYTFLWPAISDVAIAIEHVGSTAVPGLAAKPIIDIDIVSANDEKTSICITRLADLGYEHRGDLGIRGREAFLQPPTKPRHHLYLCVSGSQALANHLAVRDYLRKHPSEAHIYGAMKIELAAKFFDDIDGYIGAKTEFLVEILRKTGFTEEDLNDIARMNQS